MKIHQLVIGLSLTTGILYAGGMKIKLNKDAIAVSPVSPQGAVTVAGPPGCVFGMAPIQIMAKNKKTKMTTSGSVMPDGSFSLVLPARPKDSIELTFLAADGNEKNIKVKVPKSVLAVPPPPPGTEILRETVTIPQGGPVEQESAGAPPAPPEQPPAQPGDEQISRGEKELNASGMIE
jgi:hypothetical protein